MHKYRSLVIMNTVTLAIMLFVNFLSGASILSNATVADISHKYDTLFAPAGYAFIIWSIIFLLCICFVIYQWLLLKNNDRENYIKRTGLWFTISNLANAFWIYCWTNEWIGWSVIMIILLLFCLCALTVRLRLELDDEPTLTIFFVWWPVVVYLGWIMVATIACISSWFVYLGWHGDNAGEDIWTIIMIMVAFALYFLLIRKRNMREAATVGIWAFTAIAARQLNHYNNVAITAVIASVILLVAITIHGFKNRNYSVFEKIKRGEWK